MNRVLVVFSDGLLSELDSARGLVSRSAWIRQAVEDKLMKEAVAPLVPEGSSFADWNSPEDAAYDEPLPVKSLIEALTESVEQSKAKRKKDVRRVPDQPVSVKNRGGDFTTTQEPSSKSVKGSPAVMGSSDGSVGSNGQAAPPNKSAAESPSPKPRKPKTCQHSNIIRKLGQPFCTDCGEFV